MIGFKDFLVEDISAGSFSKATSLIRIYLQKKTGLKFFSAPGIESYKGSAGSGVGLRFYEAKKNRSLRLNWKAQPNSFALDSIDIWDGKTAGGPTYNVAFKTGVSIIKTLPLVAAIVGGMKPSRKVYTQPDGVPLYEEETVGDQELIIESASNQAHDIFDDVVDLIATKGTKRETVKRKFKTSGDRIFQGVAEVYPKLLMKKGISYQWVGSPADVAVVKKGKDEVLVTIGSVVGVVTRGGGKETYEASDGVKDIESQKERIAYEKQLDDLENLVKMVIAGASNALFVAGRGGIGKTHTVEEVLHSLGLSDGNGYFKNAGSASAAGVYSLLFKYKDSVIFFDDSDDALKDQEARNIFKAATDTKKNRKLVWNKMGKNVVDPEDVSDEDILDAGNIPRWFMFTGKIIFISNLKIDKLDPDGAIRTRAFMIEIDPTEVEIYDFMESIVDKIPIADGLELGNDVRIGVVKLLRKSKSKQSANLRKLSRALNMKAGAVKNGINLNDKELSRMIEYYA